MSCAIAIASLSAIACSKAEAADTFVGGTVDFLHTSELDTTLVGVTAGVALNEVVSVEAESERDRLKNILYKYVGNDRVEELANELMKFFGR